MCSFSRGCILYLHKVHPSLIRVSDRNLLLIVWANTDPARSITIYLQHISQFTAKFTRNDQVRNEDIIILALFNTRIGHYVVVCEREQFLFKHHSYM